MTSGGLSVVCTSCAKTSGRETPSNCSQFFLCTQSKSSGLQGNTKARSAAVQYKTTTRRRTGEIAHRRNEAKTRRYRDLQRQTAAQAAATTAAKHTKAEALPLASKVWGTPITRKIELLTASKVGHIFFYCCAGSASDVHYQTHSTDLV